MFIFQFISTQLLDTDCCNCGAPPGIPTQPQPVVEKTTQARGSTLFPPTLELRNGSNPNEGNLFINGKPVCDDLWDMNDASVACRMLNK